MIIGTSLVKGSFCSLPLLPVASWDASGGIELPSPLLLALPLRPGARPVMAASVGGGPSLLAKEKVFELPAVEGAAKGLCTWSVIDPNEQMVYLP